MIEVRLLRRPRARVLGRVPGVEVGVEVEDADGAVDLAEGAQGRQREAVVAAERDQPGLGPPRRRGLARPELLERRAHLPQRQRVVHRRRRDVAAVEYAGPLHRQINDDPEVSKTVFSPEEREGEMADSRGGGDEAREEGVKEKVKVCPNNRGQASRNWSQRRGCLRSGLNYMLICHT